MIAKFLRANSVLTRGAPMMMRGFSTAHPKKDYYQILGLGKDASIDEIKDAYRNLAKKYHPDVNASADVYEGDAEKFRDVVEAYQVLSIPESKTTYDLQHQSAPDFIYRAQRIETLRRYHDRGDDGNPKKEPYPEGSYAEFKRKFLAEERKKFNVDAFGRYKGGVPRKGRGTKRGNAFDAPGAYHDPYVHNTKVNNNPDSQFVTSRDALAFKAYMQEDKFSLTRKWTYFQASVDFDYFKFETYRLGWRWLRNLMVIIFGLTGLGHLGAKQYNRSVLNRVNRLGSGVNLTEGVTIDGRLVKRTATGTVRYA